MIIGQHFNMICPFCKKDTTWTVTEQRTYNRWEGQAPSCGGTGNKMVIVNAVGKQEWPLEPGSARAIGRQIKEHEPQWGLTKAVEWFMGACSQPPTNQDIEDYSNAYRE